MFSEIAREIKRSATGPITYLADISDGIVCSWILEEVSSGVSVVVLGVDSAVTHQGTTSRLSRDPHKGHCSHLHWDEDLI